MVKVAIDAEASVGIQNLSLAVGYDDRLFELMSSSPGSFVAQASTPARFQADDTSGGGVYVSMVIDDDGMVAASGTVVILEFQALTEGVALIALRDVSFRERGHSKELTTPEMQPISITIN